jgi:hypothetical protein
MEPQQVTTRKQGWQLIGRLEHATVVLVQAPELSWSAHPVLVGLTV